MSKLVVPVVAALLLGAISTELYTRVFPGQTFALFLLTAAAIFAGAWVSAQLVRRQPIADSRQTKREGPRQQRDRASTRAGRDSGGRKSRDERPAGAARPRAGERSSTPPDRGPTPSNGRETGQVKWFNRNKGFGFIIRDVGGEIFVHQRAITDPGRRSLRDGQRVSFAVTEHEKGLQAEAVSVVDE